MAALEVIDASTVQRWATTACTALAAAADEIDALNVYPVPDGDTGTNLALTVRSALETLGHGDPPGRVEPPAALGPALDRLARGASLGAMGNSGAIVSALLRGLAISLAQARPADGPALARALSHAADLAYQAVAEPVEGTILTVARAAADAAVTAADSVPGTLSLEGVARAAARGALQALERTPSQLAVLAKAGVVDAGGRGLCVLLDALVSSITGQDVLGPAPAPDVGGVSSVLADHRRAHTQALRMGREGGPPEYGYEVQFLLDGADEAAVEIMRADLAALGDSLVLVDAGATPDAPRLWNVHVHVNDVGAAIEAGVRTGRPHSITVTSFAESNPEASWSGRALVALAPGAGLAGMFRREGVVVVVGEQADNPSSSEVLAAIRGTGAAEVVVLPNHASLTSVADAASAQARAGGQDVAVVPTKSPVQGLAAIAVADPCRRFADDVIAVAEAAAATRWAEITVAAGEAMTTAGRCAAGDVLGLAEGDVVLIGDDQVQVTCDLLDRLLSAGGELVTLVLGSDVAPDLVDQVNRRLQRHHRGVELMDYRSDRPDQAVLIGVE